MASFGFNHWSATHLGSTCFHYFDDIPWSRPWWLINQILHKHEHILFSMEWHWHILDIKHKTFTVVIWAIFQPLDELWRLDNSGKICNHHNHHCFEHHRNYPGSSVWTLFYKAPPLLSISTNLAIPLTFAQLRCVTTQSGGSGGSLVVVTPTDGKVSIVFLSCTG